MTKSDTARSPETSLTRDLLDAARYYLRGRRGFFILAGTAAVVGLAFSWSWLAAASIAPVLLTLLPCAAMCALGLCMNRMGGRSCSTSTSASPTSQGSEADDMSTAARDAPTIAPTANGAGAPEAVVLSTPANIEPNPPRHKELTNA